MAPESGRLVKSSSIRVRPFSPPRSGSLKELDPPPPDLFLHNHPQNMPRELNSDLPVNPNCASCLDAEGWMEMVANAEARFQSMLTEP